MLYCADAWQLRVQRALGPSAQLGTPLRLRRQGEVGRVQALPLAAILALRVRAGPSLTPGDEPFGRHAHVAQEPDDVAVDADLLLQVVQKVALSASLNRVPHHVESRLGNFAATSFPVNSPEMNLPERTAPYVPLPRQLSKSSSENSNSETAEAAANVGVRPRPICAPAIATLACDASGRGKAQPVFC